MATARVIASLVLTMGMASQYAPGVMDEVVANRQRGITIADLPDPLPSVDGFVAVEDCSEIGDIIWLRPEGQGAWESFLVADCSGDQRTSDWMARNNILVEVDYATALRWETVGYGIAVEMLQLEEDVGYQAE